MSEKTTHEIRIFISSPGDVAQERDGARRVIEGLQRLYLGTTLQPVFWEDLALPVTASFQESIDFLLERNPIDIAVFILWSRLGSPLGTSITRSDGTPYRSGTERELDVMLTAFEQSDRKRPIILAYARDDDAAFKEKLTDSPTSDLEELIQQRKLADQFIREQFHDAEGRNLRAYQTYREPVGFVQRLRLHLRHAFDDLLGTDNTASWTEEPYRGLEVFEVSHAAIFHGRDEETCEILQGMRDQEQAGCAFVVIVGASGSGKSSLARAGIAASLIQNAGDDDVTHRWRVSTFVPALAAHGLCGALVRSIAELLPELNDSESALDDIAESLAENAALTVRLSISPAFARASEQAGGKVRWLLILDQLEELWTDHQTTQEDRQRFLDAIEALARSGHVSVLGTLRSDFYPHAQQMPTFLRLKGERGHYDLLPPNAASVHRLIAEPARLAGLTFERQEQTGRTLDEVILEDAARDPNALPLLQYALAELYRLRDDDRRLLTFSAYAELGGVEGALAKRANETFQSLPAEAQAALEEILPLLVSVDVAGEQFAVRRRARLAALTATPTGKVLTDHLITARFLITDQEDDSPIASLAHEALLRRWDRIATWVRANREHLNQRARVEQNQQRWEQQERDTSLLLAAGLPLDEGRQLLSRTPRILSDTTRDYIHVSVSHHGKQEKTRRRRRTMIASTLISILIAGSLLSTIFALQSYRNALQATRNARQATQLLRQKVRLADVLAESLEKSEGLLYASQIARAQSLWDDNNVTAAFEMLHLCKSEYRGWEHRFLDTLFSSNQHVLDNSKTERVTFSHDGRRIASIHPGERGAGEIFVSDKSMREVKLWNWNESGDASLAFTLHVNGTTSVAFSPDDKKLVTDSSDDAIYIWDAATGEKTGTIRKSEERIYFPDPEGGSIGQSVEGGQGVFLFSPNGELLVHAGHFLRVLDAARGDEILVLDSPSPSNRVAISAVALSSDGKRIAASRSDWTNEQAAQVRVWDFESGKELLQFTDDTTSYIPSVAFNPVGSRIVTASDHTIKIWDATDGSKLLTLSGHSGRVMCAAFSPDGKLVVSGSEDKTVKLWTSDGIQEPVTFQGHNFRVNSVAFSPTGKWIASAGSELRVWDVERGVGVRTLAGHRSSVDCVAFGPDSERIVSCGPDCTVRVWDASNGKQILAIRHDREITTSRKTDFSEVIETFSNRVYSVAFSSDGKRIASVDESGVIKVWDAIKGEELFSINVVSVVSYGDNWFRNLAFSPTDDRIIANVTGALKVWDVATGQEVLTKPTTASCGIFTPDGKRIIGGQDASITIWDAATGEELQTLHEKTGWVQCVAMSPKGDLIVSGSKNLLTVWDAESGKKKFSLHGHADTVLCVAFSPDGNRIASGSSDKTIKVWNAEMGLETITLFGHTDSVQSVAFSPDGTGIVSGSSDNSIKVWDAPVKSIVSQRVEP